MDEAIQALLADLRKLVRSATIPDDARHTAGWCLDQLAALYTKYSQTSESRYADEITRMVQGLLKELAKNQPTRPSKQPPADVAERFRLLHEQFGLPALRLPTPRVPASRSRKAS